MNTEYNTALSRLKAKIEILISKYEQFKSENEKMAIELSTLKETLNTNKTIINELEQKTSRLQLAEAFKASGTDVKEAKQKIGKLVREIDKCIALLNT